MKKDHYSGCGSFYSGDTTSSDDDYDDLFFANKKRKKKPKKDAFKTKPDTKYDLLKTLRILFR